jgi:hypothetical protein
MGDNKYSKCCTCPARMSDGRLFTSWETRRFHNLRLANKIGTNNSYDFRQKLVDDPLILAVSSTACRNSGNIKFLTEADNIQAYFGNKIISEARKNCKYVGIVDPTKYYVKPYASNYAI